MLYLSSKNAFLNQLSYAVYKKIFFKTSFFLLCKKIFVFFLKKNSLPPLFKIKKKPCGFIKKKFLPLVILILVCIYLFLM
jgi:hypothetical protein